MKKLIENKNKMFWPSTPEECIYHYSSFQDVYTSMWKHGVIFKEGIPTHEDLKEMKKRQKHTLLIVDDLLPELCKADYFERLISTDLRHAGGGITVVMIGHNIFQKSKSRTPLLCAMYHILFSNRRDQSQILNLGRQVFPRRPNVLKECYEEALSTQITQEPFPYLVIDYTLESPEDYRLRTNIFPGQYPLNWKILK